MPVAKVYVPEAFSRRISGAKSSRIHDVIVNVEKRPPNARPTC